MSKKFGKFLLFSAIAGTAAYGAYHYLQKKDGTPSSPDNEDADDDFDDFSEDLDEDTEPARERSYVSLNLDKAEAMAQEAFHKAKEVIADSVQQVRDTVRSVTENQMTPESSFTDLTALNREKNAEQASGEEVQGAPLADAPATESEAPSDGTDGINSNGINSEGENSDEMNFEEINSSQTNTGGKVEQFFDDNP